MPRVAHTEADPDGDLPTHRDGGRSWTTATNQRLRASWRRPVAERPNYGPFRNRQRGRDHGAFLRVVLYDAAANGRDTPEYAVRSPTREIAGWSS